MDDYSQIKGLSQSAMKDLAVSPLRYWYLHINPNRPEQRETPALVFGSALHCAVLEPREFDKRYVREVSKEDYSGALDTVADLRGFITDKGHKPKGTLKNDLIQQAITLDPLVQIWSVIEERHIVEHAGKVRLSKEQFDNVMGAASALRSQTALYPILADGQAEVVYARLDRTGVSLKGKLDWVNPYCTLDIKTFSQQRGKSIDQTINDAIFYECYYRQAYFYSHLREAQPNAPKAVFLIAFVESEPPFEVRLRELRPKVGGEVNMYWERARIEVRELIDLYADYWKRFGEEPWIDQQEIEQLADSDIRQFAY